jgi:hypothetical protein
MTGPKLTSLPIYKDDLEEFTRLEIAHSHRTGRKLSHPEFFKIMIKQHKVSNHVKG